MKALYKHEMSMYFTSLIGYIFIAVMIVFAGVFTSVICLKGANTRFEFVLGNMSFIYIILVPVLTMRTFAEERRQKTDQLLFSLPLSSTEIVLSKYFAMLTVLIIPTVIIGLFPLILVRYGVMNFMTTYSALLGFYFLGAALLAVGMFISSVTDNQIIAAVITLGLLLLNYFLSNISTVLVNSAAYVSFIGFLVIAVLAGLVVYLMTKNRVVSAVSTAVLAGAVIVSYLVSPSSYSNLLMVTVRESSLFNRYFNFMYEIFQVGDIMLFLSVSVAFTVLTVQALEKRRWSS